MVRIAICDDDSNMCSKLEKMILTVAEKCLISAETEVFYGGQSLIRYLKQGNRFDLIFLDIEMNDMNGIDVSNHLREKLDDIDTEIVYVTCTTQYDRKLFDFHPLAFIAKPPQPQQIKRVLDLFKKRRNIRTPYFSFTYNRQTLSIPFHEIIYFESDDRKIKVVTKTEVYSYYGRISDILTAVPVFFCQVHRSYIVNLHQIRQYGNKELCMADHYRIPVGKNYREAFLRCQLAILEEA